jgi:hypothetical protein
LHEQRAAAQRFMMNALEQTNALGAASAAHPGVVPCQQSAALYHQTAAIAQPLNSASPAVLRITSTPLGTVSVPSSRDCSTPSLVRQQPYPRQGVLPQILICALVARLSSCMSV